MLRENYAGDYDRVVTAGYVLSGAQAINLRPHWALLHQPFLLDTRPEGPVPRPAVQHSSSRPSLDHTRTTWRTKKDGAFMIIQLSDTDMATGPGVYKDAMDAHGQPLPATEANPLTVNFIGDILDVEKPDPVVLTGD